MNTALQKTLNLINQEKINALINAHNWGACWEELSDALIKFHEQKEDDHYNLLISEKDQQQVDRTFSELFVQIFLAFIHSPQVVLPQDRYVPFVVFHEYIHDVFYLAGFENTDEEVERFLTANPAPLDESAQRKLCLLLSLNTDKNIDEILSLIGPEQRGPALVGFLSAKKIFQKNVHENKIKIMKYGSDFAAMSLRTDIVKMMVKGYFYTSYLDYPDKHLIRKDMNAYIHRLLEGQMANFPPVEPKPYEGSKPHIVVYLDAFSSGHVIFKCWGDRILSLKKNFHVTIMVPKDKIDDEVRALFDEVCEVDEMALGLAILKLKELAPDILFFASLGLSAIGVILSNYRFAPLQIMGLGQPATSYSDYIDIVYGYDDLYDERAFPEDKYVSCGERPFLNESKVLKAMKFERPQDTKPKKILELGVVGATFKISYSFFKALEEISKDADFEIHLSFLSSSKGLEFLMLREALQKEFQNITVYGYQSYKSYFATLKKLDIVLSQFPYGHSNTLIDTLLAGKPCVALIGVEPHEKTGEILRYCSLADECLATSVKEYKDKFFSLAHQILGGKRDFFNPAEVYEAIYRPPEKFHTLGDTMKWIFENKSMIMSSDEKFFSAE